MRSWISAEWIFRNILSRISAVKLPIDWTSSFKCRSCQSSIWSYVGSTAVGVVAGDLAKLQKTLAGQFVQVVPAIRFGRRKAVITSTQPWFFRLLMATIQLGSEMQGLSFGNHD